MHSIPYLCIACSPLIYISVAINFAPTVPYAVQASYVCKCLHGFNFESVCGVSVICASQIASTLVAIKSPLRLHLATDKIECGTEQISTLDLNVNPALESTS